jgi:photosystem II stability/assembly factor-like uncharacterized protein
MAIIVLPSLARTRAGRRHSPTRPTVARPGLRRVTTRQCKVSTPTRRLTHAALAKAFLTACFVLAAGTPLLISDAAAQSSFSGTSGEVSRHNLGLEGGRAEDLAIASNGNLYIALSSPNGIFCSTDGATSWMSPPAGSDLGNVIAVDVGEDENTAYLIGGIELYKTSDACATFEQLTPSEEAPSDFGQTLVYGGGILLAAYRDGTVYRSADGGATLTNVTLDSSVTEVLNLTSSPTSGTFYALAEAGGNKTIYRSTDSGSTWSDIGATLGCSQCRELAVDPTNAAHLVATGLGIAKSSTDGGGSWSDISPAGMAATTPSFIGSRLCIGSKYTDDGGSSWNDINNGSTRSTELFNLMTQDPVTPTTLYMVSLRGLAKSTDGGATWTDLVSGITGVQVNGIAQSADKNTVYLAATAGLARSTDFTTGPTWTHPIDVTGNGNTISAVMIPDPSSPETVLAAPGAGRGIYKSPDGAASFSQQTITAASYGSGASVSDFAKTDAGTLVATFIDTDSRTGGALVSTDNGATWTDLSLLNNAPANTVVTLGNDILVGAGHERESSSSMRGIFRYDGSSWTEITDPDVDGELINDLLAVDASTVYAASGETSRGSVYRSTDGGLTWEDLKENGLPSDGWFHSLAANPDDPRTIYAASGRPAGNAVIMESNDGGDTWDTYYAGLKDEVPYAMLFDGLMGGFNTGLFSFESVTCELTQTGRKDFTIDLKQGTQALTNLSANGISNATATLTRIRKKKRKQKSTTQSLSDATGSATFTAKKKGWYEATCQYTDGADETASLTSERVKKRKWKKNRSD